MATFVELSTKAKMPLVGLGTWKVSVQSWDTRCLWWGGGGFLAFSLLCRASALVLKRQNYHPISICLELLWVAEFQDEPFPEMTIAALASVRFKFVLYFRGKNYFQGSYSLRKLFLGSLLICSWLTD